MGTLLLIRHGQASYGQADYDKLSPRGVEQARAIGAHLAREPALDHVFVGPHVRQQQTAQHANLSGTQLLELAEYPGFELVQHFVPRLVAEDPAFADLTSAPTPRLLDRAFNTVLAHWSEDTEAWRAPEVERAPAFIARVRAAIERAIRTAEKPGARIALVTSAGVIGAAVGQAFGLPPPRAIKTSIVIRNASITELRFRSSRSGADFAWRPDQLSLVTFNTTGHLPPDLHTER